MRTFAIAALVAAPVLSKVLAQQYDEGYEEPAYGGDNYDVASYGGDSYHSAGSYGASSASYGSRSHHSGRSYGGKSHGSDDNYSVEDYDQYHNDENNNQSPDTKYASDTTT